MTAAPSSSPARARVVVASSGGSNLLPQQDPPTTTTPVSLEVLHGGCAEAEARLLADPRSVPDPLLWAWGPDSLAAAAAAAAAAATTTRSGSYVPTTIVLSQRWGPQVTHQAAVLPGGAADVRLAVRRTAAGDLGGEAAGRYLLVCGSAATAAYLSALAAEALPLWARVARQATSCSALWSGAGAWRVEHSTSSRAPAPAAPMPAAGAAAGGAASSPRPPLPPPPPLPPVAVPVVALRGADGALEGAVRLNLAGARVEVCPLRPRQQPPPPPPPPSAGPAPPPPPLPAPSLLAAVPLARLMTAVSPDGGPSPSPLQAACSAIERLVKGAPPASSPPPALAPALRAVAEASARLQAWVEEAMALELEEEQGEGQDEEDQAATWDRQERARTLLQLQAALQYGAEAALRRLARSLPLPAAAVRALSAGGGGGGGGGGVSGSSSSSSSLYPSACDLEVSATLSVDACATSSAATSLAWALARRAGQRPRAA
jgi:hypothetical protein